jgi:hypothetical protein
MPAIQYGLTSEGKSASNKKSVAGATGTEIAAIRFLTAMVPQTGAMPGDMRCTNLLLAYKSVPVCSKTPCEHVDENRIEHAVFFEGHMVLPWQELHKSGEKPITAAPKFPLQVRQLSLVQSSIPTGMLAKVRPDQRLRMKGAIIAAALDHGLAQDIQFKRYPTCCECYTLGTTRTVYVSGREDGVWEFSVGVPVVDWMEPTHSRSITRR